ncbi:hypothetical protein B5E82_02740 [Lachnoclostridium sp. An138]|nr:hypothetical protein B5E82_02740 [Lachnoclostridium sp. An138]
MPIWSQRWQFAHTEMVKNCIQKVWKLNKQLYFPAKKSPTFVRALSVWFIGGGRATQLKAFHFPAKSTIS